MHLKKGAVLEGGKYTIEKLLGQGGFGITYLAIQSGLNRKVAIKEFFMKEHCNRDEETSHVSVPSIGSRELVERFKAKFIKEAQMISEYRHPNIVNIHDVFEENGTAYYVMEYHDGGSLSSLDLPLSVEQASGYIRQIASALSVLHENKTMHLDIKPSNVLLDKNGNVILIDFGVSKHYDQAGHQTSSTPVGISHGYAPGEQYQQNVLSFSPATDIYALGATFYKLLTGLTPPHQNEVNENGLPPFPSFVPSGIISLISKSMQSKRKDRPQSIEEFLGLLDAALTSPSSDKAPSDATDLEIVDAMPTENTELGPEPSPETGPVPSPKNKSRKGLWWMLVLFVAFVGVAAVLFMGTDDKSASLTGKHNGHEWVDLGLPSGLKWATYNVGASAPSDFGDHFSWGEVTSKDTYYTYDYKSLSLLNIGGQSKFDAATANWGGNWRMPSIEEYMELVKHCDWTWTKKNNVDGYLVTSRNNGQSIFIPAAGYKRDDDHCLNRESRGAYWSSDGATLALTPGSQFQDGLKHYYGLTIRPVLGQSDPIYQLR